MFYAQSTGMVISERYTSDIICLIFNNVYVLLSLFRYDPDHLEEKLSLFRYDLGHPTLVAKQSSLLVNYINSHVGLRTRQLIIPFRASPPLIQIYILDNCFSVKRNQR